MHKCSQMFLHGYVSYTFCNYREVFHFIDSVSILINAKLFIVMFSSQTKKRIISYKYCTN